MNRRTMIAAATALFAGAEGAGAEVLPYRMSLIGDAFDGAAWWTGVRVELDEGWKTYWRMPGESGIPPEFAWTTSAPADVEVFYPLPSRFEDASGATIGYKHEVVFPVAVRPHRAVPLELKLGLFLGVCREVCIPAKGDAVLDLGTVSRDPSGSILVASWLRRVPASADFASNPALSGDGGKAVLSLSLNQPLDDIYGEAAHDIYVHKPQFSTDGMAATLELGNVADSATLKGLPLKLTARRGEAGLEQTITLP